MSKFYKIVEALQYKDRIFSNIQEKIVDDIFFEVYINNKLVDKILTVNDNLLFLGIGQLFCAIDINPQYILENIEFGQNKINLKVDTNNPCFFYKSTCSCTITDEKSDLNKLPDKEIKLTPEVLFKAQNNFENSSEIFKETAGVHGAGLYDKNGNPIIFIPDIARHNTIIKLIGFMITNSDKINEIKESFILTSSRVNSEIIKLVRKSGIKILGSRGAPSNKAFTEAEKTNLTLISFLKKERFTIFSDKCRIEF